MFSPVKIWNVCREACVIRMSHSVCMYARFKGASFLFYQAVRPFNNVPFFAGQPSFYYRKKAPSSTGGLLCLLRSEIEQKWPPMAKVWGRGRHQKQWGGCFTEKGGYIQRERGWLCVGRGRRNSVVVNCLLLPTLLSSRKRSLLSLVPFSELKVELGLWYNHKRKEKEKAAFASEGRFRERIETYIFSLSQSQSFTHSLYIPFTPKPCVKIHLVFSKVTGRFRALSLSELHERTKSVHLESSMGMVGLTIILLLRQKRILARLSPSCSYLEENITVQYTKRRVKKALLVWPSLLYHWRAQPTTFFMERERESKKQRERERERAYTKEGETRGSLLWRSRARTRSSSRWKVFRRGRCAFC